MPYAIRWLAKPYAVFFEVVGNFPTEEIVAFNAEINSLISSGERPVHVVSDLSQLSSFPHNLIELRKTVTFLQNANIGLVIIFGAPRLAATFAQMLINLSGMRAQFVRNYGEALTHLAANDARIKVVLDSGVLSKEQ